MSDVLPEDRGIGSFAGRQTFRVDCSCGSPYCFASRVIYWPDDADPDNIFDIMRVMAGDPETCLEQERIIEAKRATEVVQRFGLDIPTPITPEQIAQHWETVRAIKNRHDEIQEDVDHRVREIAEKLMAEFEQRFEVEAEPIRAAAQAQFDQFRNQTMAADPLRVLVEARREAEAGESDQDEAGLLTALAELLSAVLD